MAKKIMIILFAFFTLNISVNAMSENELEDKLTKTYTINGNEFKASDAQVTQIKRYLAKNDISDNDANFISSIIDKTIKIIEDSGVTKFKELNNEDKSKLRLLANEVSDNTKVKVMVSKNGIITLYNTDNTLFTKFTSVIKNTSSSNITYIFGTISLIGVIYFGNKIKKSN